MVERVLAKDEIGVRFPVSAHKTVGPETRVPAFTVFADTGNRKEIRGHPTQQRGSQNQG